MTYDKLAALGMTKEEIKTIAAERQVQDGPHNDQSRDVYCVPARKL